jgi:hypothetical protein
MPERSLAENDTVARRTRMVAEDACEHDMLVQIPKSGRGGKVAILSQNAGDPEASTDEAIGDWHWLAQGYSL